MALFRVYYAKTPTFMDSDPPFTSDRLPETHVFVCQVTAPALDAVFALMQAECWSPRGQARDLICRLGLAHTSMSVGDIVADESGRYYECLLLGWREVKSPPDRAAAPEGAAEGRAAAGAVATPF